ncbi:MAG: AAA family ATPase [candidate division WOR-3 bacterium]|nr:AAA family ATPase [candidate division WOR-3 bacterium]
MLKRIYANNYRCLVNFELNLDRLTLLMGPNGGGKSSVLDLLYAVRQIVVCNARATELLPPSGLTRWSGPTDQTFELAVQGEYGLFTYRLVNHYEPDFRKQKLQEERLLLDDKPLFTFVEGDVRLYHDDHALGPTFMSDWSFSALANVLTGRPDNQKLTWFKNWLRGLFILSLQPKAMLSEAKVESEWLNRDGTNFSSWYRFLSQEHQDKTYQLTDQLRKVIPGFYAFKLEQGGPSSRILKVGFIENIGKGSPIWFDFEELSDGQRALIVLYSLLIGMKDLGHTVFLDEPENYLALPEIQPWLMELNDACGQGFPQAVLVSHHPELVDYLGAECGRWMEREPLGPTRVKEIPGVSESGLKLSEQIARGWTS